MYSDAKTCHFGETVLRFDCTFYKQSLFRENYAFRENLTHTHTHAQSDSSEFHADEKIDSASISCKVSASKNDWPVEFRIRPKSFTVQT